jgi:thiol-disulfide isomerase/thioredoxin
MSNQPSSKGSASSRVAAASAQNSSSSTRLIWIGIAVVVLVVGVLAFVVTRSDGSDGGSATPDNGGATPGVTVVPSGKVAVGPIVVTGTQLPELASGGADPAVGQIIPTIEGQTFDGTALSIGPTGEPTIIMVVAHWCPHCQREVPFLQSWLTANGAPEGVRLVALATSNDSGKPNYPAGQWLVREKWTVPTMVDDKASDGAQALGVTGFPYFIVVDAQGKVIERTSGELTAAQWEALIAAAKSGSAQPGA